MAMNNIAEEIASAIESDMQDISMFAKNLRLSRRAVRASVARNEEERRSLEESDNNFEYVLLREGSVFSIKEKQKKELLIDELFEKGKPNPLTGGEDGMVTHLDGTRTKSKVKKELQGHETDFGWDSIPEKEESEIMLSNIMPDLIRDRIKNSSAVPTIAKKAVMENLHLGSGS